MRYQVDFLLPLKLQKISYYFGLCWKILLANQFAGFFTLDLFDLLILILGVHCYIVLITKWGNHNCKVGQLCTITKWDKSYCKVGQVIQDKVGKFFTKWGRYYKVGNYYKVRLLQSLQVIQIHLWFDSQIHLWCDFFCNCNTSSASQDLPNCHQVYQR